MLSKLEARLEPEDLPTLIMGEAPRQSEFFRITSLTLLDQVRLPLELKWMKYSAFLGSIQLLSQ